MFKLLNYCNIQVLDHCSCCHICAAVEGDQCYNKSFNTPFVKGLGICGSNLDCLLRNDLSTNVREKISKSYRSKWKSNLNTLLSLATSCILLIQEKPEALCQCRDKRLVCGSDNTTYTSECKLREAAQLTPNLTVQSWYPCVTGKYN